MLLCHDALVIACFPRWILQAGIINEQAGASSHARVWETESSSSQPTRPFAAAEEDVRLNLRAPGPLRNAFLLVALMFLFFAPSCNVQNSSPQPSQAPRDDSLTAAVAEAMSIEDPLPRAARLATALQGFNEESLGEVAEARSLVEDGIRGSQTIELALLVEWWALYDPDAAFTWLKDSQRQGNPVILTSMVRSWATRAPIFASMAIEVISPKKHEATQVVRALVQGWNASGAPGLEEYLIGIRSDVNRQVALTGLAIDKVRRDG
ncbi:MAG: hypothetical protein CL917_05280, partial [Deltaproteobacteria bacterium]|nr:hypothetical protein [Deltaproteobacteria bacterium]